MELLFECVDCRWQGDVESTVEFDEDEEPIYVCPECDSSSLRVVRAKEEWQTDPLGHRLNKSKALANNWHDQGSENYLFGVSVETNVWAKIIKPTHGSCHEIWIFLILRVDDDLTIRDVDYRIDQVFPDGHGKTLSVELFPPRGKG
jgi:hypothetical protein